MNTNPAGPVSQKNKWLLAAAVLISLVYLLNCFSPLRLTHDVMRYLLIQEWMEKGFPKGTWVDRDFLPYGYSGFLFVLSKIHLYRAFFISFANLLYLTGSLYFLARITDRKLPRLAMAIFFLLNWITIKLVITPLSEMQFLFFSSGSLYFFVLFRKHIKAQDLILTVLFFVLAIFTRTVGFILPIAMGLSVLMDNKYNLLHKRGPFKWVLTLSLVIIALTVIFARALSISAYLHYLSGPWISQGPTYFLINFSRHLSADWAELFLNAPSSKINVLPHFGVSLVYFLTGLVMLVIVLYQIWKDDSKLPSVIRCYLVLYIAVIFCWPYHECRFWLPVLPYIGMTLIPMKIPASKFLRAISTAARVWYAAAGVFALSYYTYTSFNREQLAIRQDAGVWKKEYETFFFRRTSVQDGKPNPTVLYLLEKTR
jgi:hypothetical protein